MGCGLSAISAGIAQLPLASDHLLVCISIHLMNSTIEKSNDQILDLLEFIIVIELKTKILNRFPLVLGWD